jgi:soluble lytic murein transglycosylase
MMRLLFGLIALSVSCTTLAVPVAAQVVADDAIAAIEAASDNAWDVAYVLAGQDNVVTRDLVTWLRLRDGDGSFADYRAFVAARPDWPGLDQIRAKGEEAILKGTEPAVVLAWFADQAPRTGEGAVRLAEAYIATDEPDLAEEVLQAAWLDLTLTDSGHTAMIEAFPDILAPLHEARTDALLWRWKRTEVDRMLPLLAPGFRALVEARMAYIGKTGKEDDKLALVPATLRGDPGLAYDRYNWLADKGNRTAAIAILLEHSTSAEALGQPFRWSGWRRSLARWEMREGRYARAYKLASEHFLTDGDSYADLEWLSGYIALRYLDNPTQALVHFRRANAAVGSPISEGRMEYWSARAFEALGDTAQADASYRVAAQHQTGFYGLLAAEKLGLSLDPALTGANDPQDWQDAAFLNDDMTRAALTLLKGGERGAAVLFFVELGKTLDAADLSRLGALLSSMGETYYEVLLGKTAVTRGVLVPTIYFPIHDMAKMSLPVPTALALSIARRESEFNAGVGSPVGALGLMQLMPATAQEVAGLLGMPYSRGRLTSDWAYNATLGSAYLSELQDQFGYSPVQIAAGYNAGPSRPEIWMDERGDPRLGEVDVIDWIENIPFRETRNYVMRVAESIPVYEARLSGRTGPVQFLTLLQGEKPITRPLARGEGTEATVATSDAPASAATATENAPAVSARPLARPAI